MDSLSLYVDNLPIDGVGEVPVWSNEEVSTLGYLPARLVKLDGGGRVVLLHVRGFILEILRIFHVWDFAKLTKNHLTENFTLSKKIFKKLANQNNYIFQR